MDTKQPGQAERREMLEGLWATRPIRPQTGRTVAGVCAGIGNRYRVDPTLVKVAFVVAAMFGGSGILVYLAAVLALPSERRLAGRQSRAATAQWYANHPHLAYDHWRVDHSELGLPALDGLSRHGLRRGNVIGLIILGIIAVSSFGPDSRWSSSGLVGVALLAIGWWLLHRRTPVPPAGTSVDTYPRALAQVMSTGVSVPAAIPGATVSSPPVSTPTISTPPVGTPSHDPQVDLRKDGPSSLAPTPSTAPTAPMPASSSAPVDLPPVIDRTPPSWDPLGTARFAWDLPEPTPRAEVATITARRSRGALITVGIAVLVATGATAAALAGVDWFSPLRIVSLALAVLGVGLVITGLRRSSGRRAVGLVPLALLAIGAVVVLNAAPTISLPAGGVGERIWKPTSEREIASTYSLAAGSQTLDLRSVKLTADRSVDIRTGVGEIVILVPELMAVSSTCTANAGSVQCPAGRSGPDNSPVLNLNAHVEMGEVRLTRD